jgi:hypothetical protein
MTRKTEDAAMPMNAAEMKQSCRPRLSSQGVIPYLHGHGHKVSQFKTKTHGAWVVQYPIAKDMVLRTKMTEVIASPLTVIDVSAYGRLRRKPADGRGRGGDGSHLLSWYVSIK